MVPDKKVVSDCKVVPDKKQYTTPALPNAEVSAYPVQYAHPSYPPMMSQYTPPPFAFMNYQPTTSTTLDAIRLAEDRRRYREDERTRAEERSAFDVTLQKGQHDHQYQQYMMQQQQQQQQLSTVQYQPRYPPPSAPPTSYP